MYCRPSPRMVPCFDRPMSDRELYHIPVRCLFPARGCAVSSVCVTPCDSCQSRFASSPPVKQTVADVAPGPAWPIDFLQEPVAWPTRNVTFVRSELDETACAPLYVPILVCTVFLDAGTVCPEMPRRFGMQGRVSNCSGARYGSDGET